MLDSSGVIRQLVEMAEPLIDPAEEEEIERLERAIALSLTSPIVAIQQPVPAKASRVARFNLPLLDPPDRTPPRFVPVVPRLRSVRFRPPPAPVTPKPGPPHPRLRVHNECQRPCVSSSRPGSDLRIRITRRKLVLQACLLGRER